MPSLRRITRTRKMRWTVAAVLALIPAMSEAQATLPRSFEVASVRASQHGCGMTSISPWGSARFTVKNATMQLLLGIAFNVRPDQISAKLGWLGTPGYDVDAKPEGDEGLS